MPQFRKERVSELLKETISDVLAHDIKDPRTIGITITDVLMSPDLKSAKVFFSSLADGQVEVHLKGLARAEGFIRHRLRRELDLKYIPVLTFFYDSSFDHSLKISKLLKEIETTTVNSND
ncbi:MAG: 30S ribosome-binding factor RbfA [Desulfomonilaceae bacterium]